MRPGVNKQLSCLQLLFCQVCQVPEYSIVRLISLYTYNMARIEGPENAKALVSKTSCFEIDGHNHFSSCCCKEVLLVLCDTALEHEKKTGALQVS